MSFSRKKSILILTFILGAIPPVGILAQSFSLTVTPPLFQLTIGRGEYWASAIRVVNANPHELTAYAVVRDMAASGDEGHSAFSLPDEDGSTLGSWLRLEQDSVVIPPQGTGEVRFSVRIPDDAPPGGHYAAILTGNRPPVGPGEGAALGVASYISSLFFVRIPGNVVERGDIREFTTDREWYDAPDVEFTLRFENDGNVHVRPQGDVVITDMWGRERGKVPLNQRTDFGNVLPGTTRKFSLLWKGERSLFAAGRYSALVTVAYGAGEKQYATRVTSFWFVPPGETAAFLGGAFLLALLAWYVLRAYIRRALRTALGERASRTAGKSSGDGAAKRVIDLRR